MSLGVAKNAYENSSTLSEESIERLDFKSNPRQLSAEELGNLLDRSLYFVDKASTVLPYFLRHYYGKQNMGEPLVETTQENYYERLKRTVKRKAEDSDLGEKEIETLITRYEKRNSSKLGEMFRILQMEDLKPGRLDPNRGWLNPESKREVINNLFSSILAYDYRHVFMKNKSTLYANESDPSGPWFSDTIYHSVEGNSTGDEALDFLFSQFKDWISLPENDGERGRFKELVEKYNTESGRSLVDLKSLEIEHLSFAKKAEDGDF